jgi:hypothetical protein
MRPNLAPVLRTSCPPARAALIRSATLSAIGGRPSRLCFVVETHRGGAPAGHAASVRSAPLVLNKVEDLLRFVAFTDHALRHHARDARFCRGRLFVQSVQVSPYTSSYHHEPR